MRANTKNFFDLCRQTYNLENYVSILCHFHFRSDTIAPLKNHDTNMQRKLMIGLRS